MSKHQTCCKQLPPTYCIYLRVLRGQKKIDLNVSQSSAALTGLYNGPAIGAFYTFPNFYLRIDLIFTVSKVMGKVQSSANLQAWQ